MINRKYFLDKFPKREKFINNFFDKNTQIIFGKYKVLSEDHSYGGMWDRPEIFNLGTIVGTQFDALNLALLSDKFFSYGKGGEIILIKKISNKESNDILSELARLQNEIFVKTQEISKLEEQKKLLHEMLKHR